MRKPLKPFALVALVGLAACATHPGAVPATAPLAVKSAARTLSSATMDPATAKALAAMTADPATAKALAAMTGDPATAKALAAMSGDPATAKALAALTTNPASVTVLNAIAAQEATAKALAAVGGLGGSVIGTVSGVVTGLACGLGSVGCHVIKNINVAPIANPLAAAISGYAPSDLRAAYGLTTANAATGGTIAVVAAYADPAAASDLATYRARFGLPACTIAGGCLHVFAQSVSGGGFAASQPAGAAPNPAPSQNASWNTEAALDLAMASAACPHCSLALYLASDDNLDNLALGVKAAAATHPAAISNSYGAPENGLGSVPPETVAAFYQPGIPVIVSTGDSGQVEWPASAPWVIAVGGTTLARDPLAVRGWSERAWTSSGYGCSTLFPAAAWQTAAQSHCNGMRASADLAAVADPNTGVAIYSAADGGWIEVGGTSAAAPFVAGIFATASDYGSAALGAAPQYAAGPRFNSVWSSTWISLLGSPAGTAAF